MLLAFSFYRGPQEKIMGLTSWLPNRLSSRVRRTQRRPAAPRFRPQLEALEDRWLPSTLTVLNAEDSGPGSLRADIAAAKSGDTIVFDPSLNGQTITLYGGELVINKNLTIQGPGAGLLTISSYWTDCQGGSRVFEVDGAKTNVTISGLSITTTAYYAGACLWGDGAWPHTGIAPDGQGGAIWNGGVLTLSNCTLSGNNAGHAGYSSYPTSGGGIYNAGLLIVSGCTISGNTADEGGGIFNAKHAKLTIQSSVVTNSSAYLGADLYNANGGQVKISGDSTVGVIGP